MTAHDGAASDAALHEAALLEPPIGGLNGAAVDSESGGELAGRRQAAVLGENAAGDAALDRLVDLLGERSDRTAIDQ